MRKQPRSEDQGKKTSFNDDQLTDLMIWISIRSLVRWCRCVCPDQMGLKSELRKLWFLTPVKNWWWKNLNIPQPGQTTLLRWFLQIFYIRREFCKQKMKGSYNSGYVSIVFQIFCVNLLKFDRRSIYTAVPFILRYRLREWQRNDVFVWLRWCFHLIKKMLNTWQQVSEEKIAEI